MTTQRETLMTVSSFELGQVVLGIRDDAHIDEWVDAFTRSMLFLGYQRESIERSFAARDTCSSVAPEIEFADEGDENDEPDHHNPWPAVVAAFEKYYPRAAKYVKQCELAEVLNGEATVEVKTEEAFEALSKSSYMEQIDSVLSEIIGETIQSILVYDDAV